MSEAAVARVPRANLIFVGLVLGMLVAAISQTIVGPAMPRIVAELGGTEHYAWIATSAMLVSAVTVPIVGKLSDMYGRRGFYIAGLIVFMVGSVLAGAAQGFWWLVLARSVQGAGMGALMPLAQAIIGDIVAPRERGKYQGVMGAVFGVAAIGGPLAGGWITDEWGWRWLFYVNLPFGFAALAFIVLFLHLPQRPRRHAVDVAGFVTLSVGLTATLLATSFGGTQYPWGSWQIVTLFAAGAASLGAFLLVERRAAEPVLPLGLWRNSIFTFSNIAGGAVGMAMFGAIIYIPVFAQGVLGISATNSGAIMIPMSMAMIVTSIVVGLLITKTGSYKEFVVAGAAVMVVGYVLLVQLGAGSTTTALTLAMVVVGVGLGASMQTYTLIVQNAVSRDDLGVATAATQFFRSAGGTVGIAVLGTVLTNNLETEIPKRLPPSALAQAGGEAGGAAGAVLDPVALAQLPPAVATAVRDALAASLHGVFLVGLPFVGVALVATLFIRRLPLRRTAFAAEDAGIQLLDELNQGAAEGEHEPIGKVAQGVRDRARLTALVLSLLADEAGLAERPRLCAAVANLGDGDLARGQWQLRTTAQALTADGEPEHERPDGRDAEGAAAAFAERSAERESIMTPELRAEIAAALLPAAGMFARESPGERRYGPPATLEAVEHGLTPLMAALLGDLYAAERRA